MYWLKERFRDLALWPINLVRDFPRRSGRLWQTCLIAFKTLRSFPSELKKAKRQQNTLIRFTNWIHLLLLNVFDLFGGPEIAQFLMHLITHTTPLTPEEIKMMQALLGEQGMRYQDVRVAQGGLMKYVFQRNGNLAFATWYTINLPQNHGRNSQIPTRQNLPVVVHELTHVYQYHIVGSRYMSEAIYVLIKYNRDCYCYGGTDGLMQAIQNGDTIANFNREQQAQIVQDYFMRQQNNEDISSYLTFLEQVKIGQI